MPAAARSSSFQRPSRRWLAAGASAGVHVAILAGLLAWRDKSPIPSEPIVVTVSLVRELERPPSATFIKGAPAKAVKSPAYPTPSRPTPTVSTAAASDVGSGDVLSGAALGSATAADALPGGECDMARRLQAALRSDALVRAAVAARGLSGASAILVWDGGWVASPGENGKGLAAVREAIVWEVAFAPPACRAERVHGPVLFSVSDGGARTRIAVGAGDWRWDDLVSSR